MSSAIVASGLSLSAAPMNRSPLTAWASGSDSSCFGIGKKSKSSPGTSDSSHSAGAIRLMNAPWFWNAAWPDTCAQIASVKPVASVSSGKYASASWA